MKWQRVNANCIRSGGYTISRYTLGGLDYYEIYHGETRIGSADNGNDARKMAIKHADKQGVSQ